MRAALCHEWTTIYGGSEQVASRLATILDINDVFTFAADPPLVRQVFPGRSVQSTEIGLTRFGREQFRWLLPGMPRSWSSLDLSDYDVVVTSSHSCANAIRVRPDAMQISYCYTPMRYAWDWRPELGRVPLAMQPLWPMVAAVLRRADRTWAKRVTAFITSSNYIAGRIRTCYGRDATVVHPPIDTDYWSPEPSVPREDFFLLPGRLVPYKRPELAVRAAARAGARLVVAGAGPELDRLHRIAGPGTVFVVSPSKAALRNLYRRCRAMLNPGIEDFGMTMAEAQACGAPVIARAAGGALDIVDGRTGVLYEDPEALEDVLRAFAPAQFDSRHIASRAGRFSVERFDEGIRRVVHDVLEQHGMVAVNGIEPPLVTVGLAEPKGIR